MTETMFGAVIALTTIFIAIWVFESLARFTTNTGAANPKAAMTRLTDVASQRWRPLLAATSIALGAAALAGQSRLPATAPGAQALQEGGGNTARDGDMASVYGQLRTFAEQGEGSSQPLSQSPIPAANAGLPGVDTMIEKLAARLQKQPNDAEGWRMLGWSYFHTDRFGESVDAYEHALKLAPDDAKIRAALDEARRATGVEAAPTGKGPTSQDIAAAQGMTEQDRQAMIAGMVDGLASRLAASPRDEEGWIKLMRSRMVLGKADAAAKALETARQTFASDAAVLDRLAAAARSLGVPGAQ